MVEITDITDRDSFEAWLVGRPREVSIWIANRAAMRVLPEWWYYVLNSFIAKHADLNALQTLQHNLISGFASKMLSAEIKHTATAVEVTDDDEVMGDIIEAALSASIEAGVYSNTTYSELGTATNAARAADDAIKTINAATHGAYAVNAVTDTFLDFWALVESDCAAITAKDDLYRRPLWGDQNNPLDTKWKAVKEQISVTNPLHPEEIARGAVDWSFWIKWYDAALEGRPLNWDMLEEIALIEDQEWEKGPARVNFLIAEIEQEYAKSRSFSAEVIQRDAQAGKFETVPVTGLSSEAFNAAKRRMRDGVDKVRSLEPSGNFDLVHELADEMGEVDDYLQRYNDAPMRIYEVCVDVILAIDLRIDDGALPRRDAQLERFRRQFVRSSLDMRDGDEEIRKTLEGRAAIRFDEFTDEQRVRYLALTEAARSEANAKLSQELAQDCSVAIDEDARSDKRDESRHRSGGRLIRMGEKKREEAVKLADDAAKVNKGVQALGGAWSYLRDIWDWFI